MCNFHFLSKSIIRISVRKNIQDVAIKYLGVVLMAPPFGRILKRVLHEPSKKIMLQNVGSVYFGYLDYWFSLSVSLIVVYVLADFV